MDGAYSMHGIN